ncbi:MAG: response regulator, partial [Chitinophagaceae bacterium]|nr:response regulator [Chitinophagaceae bacterium]
MMATHILWIDDETDSLTPQILFLEQKGYQVSKASNGYDGLEFIKNNAIDLVLLDESMPG